MKLNFKVLGIFFVCVMFLSFSYSDSFALWGTKELETEKSAVKFAREFEHASVWVDTEKRRGRITWR